jgi:hypothetical protein
MLFFKNPNIMISFALALTFISYTYDLYILK